MGEEKEDIRAALETAVSVPRVPVFGHYVAHLTMLGSRCVPRGLWAALGGALVEVMEGRRDVWHGLEKVGAWEVRKNHFRSESHEEWQSGPEFADQPWFVPVEELAYVHLDDGEADDFITITRLTFSGTEAEVYVAAEALVRELTALSVHEG
jgi:hypothetical protein